MPEDKLNFEPGSKRSNLKLLAALHHTLQPKTYLEIGVRWGDSLVLSGNRSIALGVDPQPQLRMKLPRRTWLSRLTSDTFFSRYGWLGRLSPRKVDLALIDGMHLAEYVVRDFINMEKIMAPDGVIVLDDTNPPQKEWATRKQIKGMWTGDVWKALAILLKFRPDLKITTFSVQPAGLTVIRGLNPASRVLAAQYDEILKELDQLDFVRDFEGHIKSNVQAYTPQALAEALA